MILICIRSFHPCSTGWGLFVGIKSNNASAPVLGTGTLQRDKTRQTYFGPGTLCVLIYTNSRARLFVPTFFPPFIPSSLFFRAHEQKRKEEEEMTMRRIKKNFLSWWERGGQQDGNSSREISFGKKMLCKRSGWIKKLWVDNTGFSFLSSYSHGLIQLNNFYIKDNYLLQNRVFTTFFLLISYIKVRSAGWFSFGWTGLVPYCLVYADIKYGRSK